MECVEENLIFVFEVVDCVFMGVVLDCELCKYGLEEL